MTLSLAGVSRAFGGVRAVDDATFTVGDAEVHGLIGPNGAGKTTLLNLISGLLQPTSGRIELDGERIDRLPPHRVARKGVARTYQNIRLFAGLSAVDNVVVGEHQRRRAAFWRRLCLFPSARREEQAAREAAEALLARVGMRERAALPASSLSYGEQRRVEIARALASRPNYMLLDEPFAGIDPKAVVEIQRLVRRLTSRGIGVLITDHNVRETLDLTDRSYIIYSGQVLMEGRKDDIVNDPEVRRLYLGEDFRA